MSLSKLASDLRRVAAPVTERAAESGPEAEEGAKKEHLASSSAREVEMLIDAMLTGSASAVEAKAKRIVPEEKVPDFYAAMKEHLPATIALVLQQMGVRSGALGARAKATTRKLVSAK